jgi:TetR/AcrR family transcriptional regulator, regulator of cefoperazone and chloramphenicol sensitivity
MQRKSVRNNRGSSNSGTSITAATTKAKLVEAAGEIFAEAGYHHATIREICNRAGVNVAAVNYHFRDKTGLYTEVVRQSIRAARLDAVRAALEQHAEPEEILRAVVKARLGSCWSQELGDWHFRIVTHELAKPTPAMNNIVNEAIRPVYMRLREVISKLIGLPPDHEQTILCAHSIIGQIVFYALAGPVLVKLWPGLKFTPEQVDRIADHIANFSLAYLRDAARKPKGKRKKAVRKPR